MATVGVVADVAPEPHLALLPTSITSYNITLNLTSILSLIPGSSLLARFRKGMHQQTIFGVNGGDSLSQASESLTSLGEWTTASMSMFEGAGTGKGSPQVTAAPVNQAAQVPSPWGFFTSGYMIGLFIMAILLHRMQNIVLPSRLPLQRQRRQFRRPQVPMPLYQRISPHRLYNFILPMDFAKTSTRLVLHLPSIYVLSKMLLVWMLLVLQTCELLPLGPKIQRVLSTDIPWLASIVAPLVSGVEMLERWFIQKDMAQICWATFCAVCAAFLVEGFIKALNGIGSGFPIGTVNPNTSPFNLIGYAFLLHVYSSPMSHSFHPGSGLPSRPDKHTIISITIPLLQQTIFHVLSVSKRLSAHRLLPTALTSFLSLIHFHGTILKLFSGKWSIGFAHSKASPSHSTAPPFNTESLTSYSRAASSTSVAGKIATSVIASTVSAASPMATPAAGITTPNNTPFSIPSYPLLNLIPNMFETFLLGTILLTVVLNIIVQLLVRGRVERVFSGLNAGSLTDDDTQEDTPANRTIWSKIRSFFLSLPLHEDFGVLLLRLGTASLEATGLRGWGNEVAPIRMPIGYMSRARLYEQQDRINSEYGTVRMGRVAVGEVQPGYRYENVEDNSRRIVPMPQFRFGDDGQVVRSRHRGGMGFAASYFSAFASGRSVRRPVQTTGLSNEVRTIEVGGEGDNQSSEYDSEVYDESLGRVRGTGAMRARRGAMGTRRSGGPWKRWLRALWPFVKALWGVARGLMRWFVYTLLERARRAGRGNVNQVNHDEHIVPSEAGVGQRRDPNKRPSGRSSRGIGMWGVQLDMMDDEMREVLKNMEEREVYLQFLRGEDISDDEEYREEDEQEEDQDEDEMSGDEEEEGEEGEQDEQENGEEEAFGLFTDILRNGAQQPWREGSVTQDTPSTPSSSRLGSSAQTNVSNGELVLAHLMHGQSPPNQSQFSSPGPLTRRRWNALVDTTASGRKPRAAEVAPRSRNQQADYVFEHLSDTEGPLDLAHPKVTSLSQCVICLGSARDIICWPCRCLAMCDQCRENLATRSSSSKHHCPCCRQPVDGYSRIYIP